MMTIIYFVDSLCEYVGRNRSQVNFIQLQTLQFRVFHHSFEQLFALHPHQLGLTQINFRKSVYSCSQLLLFNLTKTIVKLLFQIKIYEI